MEDVEGLRIERDAKYKQKDNINETLTSNIGDHFKKEVLNMKIQIESMFEKTRLNSDKLIALDVEQGIIQKKIENDFTMLTDPNVFKRLVEEQVVLQ
jgi:hypothetical protein